MRRGIQVVDAHMHLFSHAVFERERSTLANATEAYRSGYETWKEGFRRRFNSPFAEDPGRRRGSSRRTMDSPSR